MRKVLLALGVGAAAATPAYAQNYDSLTAAVDFTSTIAALTAVAATIILVLLARKGIRYVFGMLR